MDRGFGSLTADVLSKRGPHAGDTHAHRPGGYRLPLPAWLLDRLCFEAQWLPAVGYLSASPVADRY